MIRHVACEERFVDIATYHVTRFLSLQAAMDIVSTAETTVTAYEMQTGVTSNAIDTWRGPVIRIGITQTPKENPAFRRGSKAMDLLSAHTLPGSPANVHAQ